MAVEQRDLATAKRLGRLFAEDLGWGDHIESEVVELALPPSELTRAIARLHKDATDRRPEWGGLLKGVGWPAGSTAASAPRSPARLLAGSS